MNTDRHILIVGGSKGVGLVFAKKCLDRGWKVSTASRYPQRSIPEVRSMVADISKPGDFRRALSESCKSSGLLTALAFFQRARGEGPMWKEHMQISVEAVEQSTSEALEFFKLDGDKSILIASSIASSFVASEQNAAYHASRAAQVGLMRYLALKLGPRGIRVNCISMGTIVKPENEDFFSSPSVKKDRCVEASPLGRLGQSTEIATAAEFLCSESSSWITGQNIVCDGGVSLAWRESN